MIQRCLFFLYLIFGLQVFGVQAAFATKSSCVVILLKHQDEYMEFTQALEGQFDESLEKIRQRIDLFIDQPQALKTCLEGSYASVVLVAHSTLLLNQTDPDESVSSLLYYKTVNGVRKGLFYPDQVFQNVRLSQSLKHFGIATCHSEKLARNYPSLIRLFKTRRIAFNYAEADVVEDSATLDLRYRSFNSAIELIRKMN